MAKYINPARKVIASATRKGGPMDSMRFEFVCTKCGKQVTLSLRDFQKNSTKCLTCEPGTLTRINKNSDSQT